ncbi:MAG: triose-phosphate isomerase [Pseudomonadota bacterium]|nr:triose-phosphate isomerase [Pseudomonadota bacterium]
MKNYLIAANWKQNGNLKSLSHLTRNIIALSSKRKIRHKIILFPPAIYLFNIDSLIKNKKNILLGVQNISPYNDGAFTGEVSSKMAKDSGCNYVIIGHSERRHIFGESDLEIQSKVSASNDMKMNIILCVGETASERRKKMTKKVITKQLRTALFPLRNKLRKSLQKLVIAYEPVWAIGTGKNATTEQISDIHNYIAKSLSNIFGRNSLKIKILYGGSVNTANAKTILELDSVDGALVGGASLQAKKFIEICSSI